jgi:hypothetical protein
MDRRLSLSSSLTLTHLLGPVALNGQGGRGLFRFRFSSGSDLNLDPDHLRTLAKSLASMSLEQKGAMQFDLKGSPLMGNMSSQHLWLKAKIYDLL